MSTHGAPIRATPPRFARAFVSRALPADVRDDILGDLEEAFARDVATSGPGVARRRYRRKALTLAGRFTLERWRQRLRALTRFRFSLLDLRLALRMLRRYPVLSAISTISLALGVALGAIVFAVIAMFRWPSLPMPDGDRIVRIQMHDDVANGYESRLTADFLRWRTGRRTMSDVGAWWDADRNLTAADGTIQPVPVAEVTASMFSLAGARPVLGRGLTDADAAIAAPPVMVMGERLWRERFGGDPTVIGRAVMLGDTPTTVVGVLPERFRFPVRFEVWQPLKLDESRAQPRQGRGFDVWARLQPGATIADARLEMTQLARQEAIDWPATHAHLTPVVNAFAASFSTLQGEDRVAMYLLNPVVFLLIFVISGNVALLMFARASTRESEIVVRAALGAGRARIIGQFCAESAVLSGLALGVGLMLARWGLRIGFDQFVAASKHGRTPAFWYQPTLPLVSVAYAVGIALFAALVTGVLPGMKATRGLASRLRESTPGAGGLKFGGVWTALIVAQVALTVMVPVMLYFVRASQQQVGGTDIGVPQAEYLVGRLAPGPGMTKARFVQSVQAVRDALPSIAGVSHATMADRLPLFAHGYYVLQTDAGGAAPLETDAGYHASVAAVAPDFFEHFEMTPLSGRLFSPSDYNGTARVAVVNQLFVERIFGGRNPVGRRVKFVTLNREPVQQPGNPIDPWIEIVGVVRNVCMGYPGSDTKQGLYVPLDLRRTGYVWVTARVPGAAPGGLKAQESQLRAVVAKTDPSLLLSTVETLPDELAISIDEIGMFVRVLGAMSGWVMLLALSGIYAVMSFAVSKRTREIGIRIALGSDRGRVVMAILRGPMTQIGAGIVLGTAMGLGMGKFTSASHSEMPSGLALYVVLIVTVCALACLAPVRRAMSVDPIAALRND